MEQAMGLILHISKVFVILIPKPWKRVVLEDQAKKWKKATYLMYLTTYLDILSWIRRISIAMQSDFHDPVKMGKRIWDFSWEMAKLVLG